MCGETSNCERPWTEWKFFVAEDEDSCWFTPEHIGKTAVIYIFKFIFNWVLLDAIGVERKAEIDQCVLCEGSEVSPLSLLGGQIWVGLWVGQR